VKEAARVPPTSSRRALVVLWLAVVLGACSSGGDAGGPRRAAAGDGGSAPVPTTAAPVPTYPLTGLPVTDPATAARPALVVKIDNAPKARPQAGLDRADIVFEELVEGGVTRFLAVFQSRDADPLGPVRSVRPVDPDIVTPLGGLFAYSGGAPKFQAMIRRAPVTDVGADAFPDAYRRDRSRPAPNNLFTRTPLLYTRADGQAPPPRWFDFRRPAEPFTGSGLEPVGRMVVSMGQRTSAAWTWDAGSGVWRRATNGTPHVLAGGGQYGAENVLLQFVPYRATDDLDVGNNHVPTAEVTGTGDVIALSGGHMVRGRWRKPAAASVTEYEDLAGRPIRLAPGRTWVMLVPVGAYHAVEPVDGSGPGRP
jgi:hypothetical protein